MRFFYGAEGLLYDEVKAEVETQLNQHPGFMVYGSGHSMGGSVAAITLLHFMYDNIIPAQSGPVLYTFGEPRTGDYKFAMEFMKRIPSAYRVVHYKDIVSHLPPCHAGFNSKLQFVCLDDIDPSSPELWAYHHGVEVWYAQDDMPDLFAPQNGTFRICAGEPIGEDVDCSDGLILKDSIDNHLHYFSINGVPFRVGLACNTSTSEGADVSDLQESDE